MTADWASQEQARVQARRQALQLPDEAQTKNGIGLALSGGGIRSATFSLGVLQGLAKTGVLPRFDYLSTVSGGGYAGAFFSALFLPQRLRAGETAAALKSEEFQQQAQFAYQALQHSPGDRLTPEQGWSSQTPLAWLRENGRYLAPQGAGDYLFAAAIAIRNWFGLHYVIGIALVTFFVLLALTRALLTKFVPGWDLIEQFLQPAPSALWWSPAWLLAGLMFIGWLVPCAGAYWMTQTNANGKYWQAWFSPPALVTVLACALFFALAFAPAALGFSELSATERQVVLGLAGLGTLTLVVYFTTLLIYPAPNLPTALDLWRNRLTAGLTRGLKLTLVIAGLALMDTLGQSLYRWLAQSGWQYLWQGMSAASIYAAIIWLVHRLAALDTRKLGKAFATIPLSFITASLGVVLLLVTATAWAALAQGIFWGFQLPDDLPAAQLTHALSWSAFLLVLTVGTALTRDFVNLSSIQNFYQSRLTRAYLGASNAARFASARAAQSVAEPHVEDGFGVQNYYAPQALGPLHLINVTVNETETSGEALVQRDRKGRLLATAPSGLHIDNQCSAWHSAGEEQISIQRWVAISGAAFTTGLGRQTSLGVSLLFGFANVRLGYWWKAGKLAQTGLSFLRRSTQRLLWRELMGRFAGKRQPLWYLSDGGHYENTGAYELLRRRLRFIVVSDNGADPDYRFDDLANLVRLARIDMKIELQLMTHPDAQEQPGSNGALYAKLFGTPEQFRQADGNATCCALLYRVIYPDAEPGTLLVIKPRLVPEAGIDLRNYAQLNASFPQQTTFDQFFDEAQWESYRKLGELLSTRLFGLPVEGTTWHAANLQP